VLVVVVDLSLLFDHHRLCCLYLYLSLSLIVWRTRLSEMERENVIDVVLSLLLSPFLSLCPSLFLFHCIALSLHNENEHTCWRESAMDGLNQRETEIESETENERESEKERQNVIYDLLIFLSLYQCLLFSLSLDCRSERQG
jgi:phosphate/sulfate permease